MKIEAFKKYTESKILELFATKDPNNASLSSRDDFGTLTKTFVITPNPEIDRGLPLKYDTIFGVPRDVFTNNLLTNYNRMLINNGDISSLLKLVCDFTNYSVDDDESIEYLVENWVRFTVLLEYMNNSSSIYYREYLNMHQYMVKRADLHTDFASTRSKAEIRQANKKIMTLTDGSRYVDNSSNRHGMTSSSIITIANKCASDIVSYMTSNMINPTGRLLEYDADDGSIDLAKFFDDISNNTNLTERDPEFNRLVNIYTKTILNKDKSDHISADNLRKTCREICTKLENNIRIIVKMVTGIDYDLCSHTELARIERGVRVISATVLPGRSNSHSNVSFEPFSTVTEAIKNMNSTSAKTSIGNAFNAAKNLPKNPLTDQDQVVFSIFNGISSFTSASVNFTCKLHNPSSWELDQLADSVPARLITAAMFSYFEHNSIEPFRQALSNSRKLNPNITKFIARSLFGPMNKWRFVHAELNKTMKNHPYGKEIVNAVAEVLTDLFTEDLHGRTITTFMSDKDAYDVVSSSEDNSFLISDRLFSDPRISRFLINVLMK